MIVRNLNSLICYSNGLQGCGFKAESKGNKSNEESRFEQSNTWSQIVVQRTKGLSVKGDYVLTDVQNEIACVPTSLLGTVSSERGRSRHSTLITWDDKLPAHRGALSFTSWRRSTAGGHIDNLGTGEVGQSQKFRIYCCDKQYHGHAGLRLQEMSTDPELI